MATMKLFLDACAIIYLIESYQQQGQQTRRLVTEEVRNSGQLVVSSLSLLECRILPLRNKNTELLAKYHQFFTSPHIQLVQLTNDIIDIATDIRVRYSNSLRTPDALQLACALKANTDKFLTGDKKLSILQEIQVIIV
jgi:predicted nucleic acid-binding protein